VKKTSYGERDYAFGQRMLRLRMSIGLTQAGLAGRLRVARQAVGEWEAGSSYPKAEHLKALLTLCLQQQVFAAGREEEEIRALWKAAHQKVLLDEPWLQGLLSPPAAPRADVAGELTPGADLLSVPPAAVGPRVDWGEALDVPSFYGRQEELALLAGWVGEQRCRVVSVLGLGGIGKSALAVTVMHRVASQFEVVIWRSLRDAPACSTLVEECLQVLAPHLLRDLPDSLEERLRLLLEQLRARRVLLVLDNLEVLLEEGEGTGRMRAGYEGYGHLLRRMGETAHQSCLLLTSREKPADLVPLEGRRAPVRALRLAGLDGEAGAQLLAEQDVADSRHERVRLVEAYRGNPLALKIVAQTISELFGGEIAPFLAQGEVVFGGVRELLDEQFARLSSLEQSVFSWLAILREPVSLEGLLAVLAPPRAAVQVLEALDGLLRRSLIERGQRPRSFTLQSVVLEYVTGRLIAQAASEIEQGHLDGLISYGLCQAQAKDYVRAIQEHLLVVPLLSRLERTYQGRADLQARLLGLLDDLRGLPQTSQGYGPANLMALLRVLRGDLRGLDLSRLALRGAYLQGIQMQDANLSGALLRESVLTEAFDAILAVATSQSGQYWAAGSRRGEVRVWAEAGRTLHLAWQAHIAAVLALAFSSDGRTLASGSYDGSVKLWDVERGTLLWTGWHTGGINGVAFAPDGRLLATGGGDTLVQLWDPHSGTNVQRLSGQGGAVHSLAWGPDGRRLASGCSDGSIWVWQPEMPAPEARVRILTGHTHWVTGLAFAPDGARLASASLDGTIKLWDMERLDPLQTFTEQTDQVLRVAWSPDGRTLASAGIGQLLRLRDVTEGKTQAVLHEHTAVIYALAFTPDSRNVLSGSDDGTIRVWDVERGQCLRVMGGYVASLFDLDWSPDGRLLASGGANTLVTIWDGVSAPSPRVLRGHRWVVQGVAWSPDGQLLASVGYDSLRLWDPATGVCLQVLRDPDAVDTIFLGVAWSPDGRWLACGSYLRGVQVWEMPTRSYHWVEQTQQPARIRRVAWSPDGTRLVGAGDDGFVYVWDATAGTLLQRLAGHSGGVMNVAWSSDGRRLASAGGGREGGELFVWEADSGKRVQALARHPGVAFAVVWSPSGKMLVSGSSDGMLRWWEVDSGHCVRVQEAHQGTVHALKVTPDGSRLASCGDDGVIRLWNLESGELLHTLRRDRPYERLTITGIRGLTEAQKASLRALGAFENTSVGG
jgi:WD40 repeat protein/transcriptional regulator with XRE-family HTH domain